ncbi:DUF1622 domain-containing protein [Deinococcus sp. YIM 134068]|uniref:DUF1622 domain-containing protein n=1 Tax=Deinococcus lichenicola TaxID=3118910 RepID=UPI002F938CC0
MEELSKEFTSYLSVGVETAAALIIAFAVVQAAWRVLRMLLARPAEPDEAKEGVRLRLARWLAVALEFELAADILRTAIAPTWDEIGKLAAIAALRTLLNYFLQKEIEQNAQKQRAVSGASPLEGRAAPGTAGAGEG